PTRRSSDLAALPLRLQPGGAVHSAYLVAGRAVGTVARLALLDHGGYAVVGLDVGGRGRTAPATLAPATADRAALGLQLLLFLGGGRLLRLRVGLGRRLGLLSRGALLAALAAAAATPAAAAGALRHGLVGTRRIRLHSWHRGLRTLRRRLGRHVRRGLPHDLRGRLLRFAPAGTTAAASTGLAGGLSLVHSRGRLGLRRRHEQHRRTGSGRPRGRRGRVCR